ncbi:fumarylacetoacetate hydrolase family protein [Desertimonas flava]|jgi:2-keto-4-pentenoate hydratase/2-oxohepta-3-ene-1,7-dioic acid hydratase in catechol pathway|uniref:fumarylacetoacetate hydrolase family protein n=1 Tax=Desertimonas flava TaxID=2064846 RepID=UPI000E3442D8|nr:fumarylacetoacetate hydrolase family protein [Desertimonas flava]
MGFRLGNVDGRAVLVEGDGVFDLERASGGRLGPEAVAALAATDALHEVAGGLDPATADHRLADVVLGPPVPTPRSVLGIGVNYRDHAAETGHALPPAPLVFAKVASCLAGPTDDIVLASATTDYEAELVLVIGAEARDVPSASAWDVVAGVMVGQDVSDRELQNAGQRPQFTLGKSHDTYGPTGPFVVSTDLLPDRDALAIRCEVNGEVRQNDTTANLIFDVPALVAYLSSQLTLRPGDLVFTGTPSGVGLPTGNFLRPGDIVHTVIDGVGELVNRVR